VPPKEVDLAVAHRIFFQICTRDNSKFVPPFSNSPSCSQLDTGVGEDKKSESSGPGLRAVPSRILNRKQKQSSFSGMFFRISFIPNNFNRNRNRNRFVAVTIKSVTICDQNVTKPVLLEKLQKQNRQTNSVTNSNL